MNHLLCAQNVFDIEIAALQAVRGQLDASFNRAVEIIVNSLGQPGGGKVIVTGVGKSGDVGRKIAATFTSTGSLALFLNPADALHGDLGMVRDLDVILALSCSGETEELIRLMWALRWFLVPKVAMTGAPQSTLAQRSDVVLSASVPREACPFNLTPTASSTAMLALGDALAMAVLVARGLKVQDFARFHPSGAIGRAVKKNPPSGEPDGGF